MRAWLEDKLKVITQEFLDGGGYGDVFEAQYLVYLECIEATRGGDPNRVWVRWRDHIGELLVDGQEPMALNHLLKTRQELVDALLRLKRSFSGPSRARFIPPVERVDEVDAGTRFDGILGMFGGDDE